MLISCAECATPKAPDCFYVDRSRPRGRVARCKECYAKQQQTDRLTKPGRRYGEIRGNALKRGLAWNLSRSDYELLFWNAPCFFCKAPAGGGVDRVGNEPFYSLENTIACCGACNQMKGSLSLHDFLARVQKVYLSLIDPTVTRQFLAELGIT